MKDSSDSERRVRKATEHDPEVAQFLYQKSEKIYPRQVQGLFARLRVMAVLVLLGVYYGLPWLNWNERQAILFDLPARQFHLFGITFWPQDFFYLTTVLIIAALSLFFFTALAGRLWCGYACPQTVWTETFMWIERRIEGDRPQQMKRDQAPWTARKFAVKGSKHALWLTYAVFTGITFVGYFVPIRELFPRVLLLDTGGWELFWVAFYSLATYGNAGWLREQVCLYMCPYARFQSAMFDPNTLIISYDEARGEPRGPRKRGIDHRAARLGDCIDCTICVQVCPTGIDIRNGLQYECIACAACIDACDQVMDKMQYPRGLIRYTTESALRGKPERVLRPRVVLYSLLLLGLMAGLATSITLRTPLDIDVIRDRNVLYRTVERGLVSNTYTLRILNKDQREHVYRLEASGLDELELVMDRSEFRVAPGEILDVPVSLRVDPIHLTTASNEVVFHIQSIDDPNLQAQTRSRFIGPVMR